MIRKVGLKKLDFGIKKDANKKPTSSFFIKILILLIQTQIPLYI